MLVGEDHRELRRLVLSVLVSAFAVIGAVDDGDELIETAILHQPDVIICNIDLPFMGGFGVRQELSFRGIRCPFVFTAMLGIEMSFRKEDGAVGYVHRTDVSEELNLAVGAVARKGFYVSRSFRE